MQGRKLSFPFTEQLVCRGVMGKCPLGFRSHATGGEMGGQGPLVILGPMFRLTNVQDCRPRPKLSCKSPTTDKCLNPDPMACAATRSVPRPLGSSLCPSGLAGRVAEPTQPGPQSPSFQACPWFEALSRHSLSRTPHHSWLFFPNAIPPILCPIVLFFQGLLTQIQAIILNSYFGHALGGMY